jgi:hypothetical protein
VFNGLPFAIVFSNLFNKPRRASHARQGMSAKTALLSIPQKSGMDLSDLPTKKPEQPEQHLQRMYNPAMAHCRYCFHPRRDEIDRLYIAGTPLRTIIANFGGSLGAASRHRQHVKDLIKDRLPGERAEIGSDLIHRVESLLDEAKGILSTAKTKENLTAAVAAVNACTRLLELVGRLDGTLVQPNTPGLHLTLNRVTNTTINAGSDEELAILVAEATDHFSEATIARLKALAAASENSHTSAITNK